jgi:hypothetical protein
VNYQKQKYFLYDPEGEGMEYFDSEEARDEAAKEAVALYLTDGFWYPEVINLIVGVVTASAQQVDRVNKPDNLDEDGVDESGVSWDSNYDYTCDYRLLPIDPEKSEKLP